MQNKKIILSDEVRSIFPKSENEDAEMTTLEKSLKEEGCRDNMVVWKEKNILLDGYRRHPLCIKHDIPFGITYMSFSSLEDAKGWAAINQLSRRNLTKWERGVLVKNYRMDYYKKLAEKNQKLSNGRGKKGKKDITLPFNKIDVTTELAREAGMSRDTMVKLKYVSKNGYSELFSDLDSNQTSINKAYNTIRRRKKAIGKAKKNEVMFGYINDLSKGVENNVICMDVLKGLELIADKSVSLIFTSPPFNVGMPYKGVSDSRTHKNYMQWIEDVLSAMKAKLRPGGRLVIEIENTRVKNSEGKNIAIKYPIEAEVTNIATKLGYIYRDTIQWNKGSVGKQVLPLGSYSPSNPCIRNTHSNVIVFSKDQLNLPCVTGDPSFLEKKYYDQLTKSGWDIFPEHHAYGTHCCPMPVKLAQQAIELLSYRGDLVLDPFGGSASTAIACIRTGRRFIHIDASETYCAEAKNRIDEEITKLQTVKKAA